ncbi:MAG: cytochrome c oxidase accessory protein CcoG [Calditrichaeota bacterium]|nr:MAG: cytochrome c oxidase accessory protein CcoG [Calditrichota bacterium]
MPELETKTTQPAAAETAEDKRGSFRDTISTVDKKGKRIWIYPKKVTGNFYRARSWVSIFLLVFLFGAPFVHIHGQPLLLFNFLERKFIIFGLAFWPQDFHLFVLATIAIIVFILLFTAVFGRVWCGWACPQTVFMEMVFRKIEYFIEGDARHQRALNAAPWTTEKIFKKGTKHTIFFAISFLIGNTFMAYIVGSDRLIEIISQPPWHHWAGFIAVLFFSLLFYWIFAYFREQACVLVCPYGRFQSVLLDPNSIVISYDFVRGEPRGKFSKKRDRSNLGDCIDCRLCVDVCPTGIDIRNGTQLECINCANCIDACNSVMDKVGFSRGLIRYSSYNGIAEGKKKLLTPRMVGYSAILVFLVSVLFYMLMGRSDIEATILRAPGVLFQKLPNGHISNLYTVKIVNKTFSDLPVEFKLKSPKGQINLVGDKMVVPQDGLAESALFVEIPRDQLKSENSKIVIQVFSGDKLLDEVKSSFIGPSK